VIVGTSFYEQPFPSDTNKVFAFDAATGAQVPGWPVSTTGPALGSPAIGVIDGSGLPAVVETSWICSGATESTCFGANASMVYAWNGRGKQMWSRRLLGPTSLASPVLVPLKSGAINDVLVGSPNGLYPLDGATGAFLFGTNGTNQFATINPGCRVFNSSAVADLVAGTVSPGWFAFEACGGPPAFHDPGEILSYPLPRQAITSAAWPMFRGSPGHTGVAFASLLVQPKTIPGIASEASGN
jgi:outer membrane protein assembly factor BamB